MPNRHPTSSPISSRPSRPRVRIIPYNYIRFGTTPSGLEIEIKLSCFYAIGKEEEGGKEWKTERERERNGRTRTRRDRAARLEGKERERNFSRRVCSATSRLWFSVAARLRFRSLPLAPVFPLALPLNPHVLIFPGISVLTLRLCKGLYRGVDRSSCSSTYPEIRRLHYAPNFVFSAVNSDRAISGSSGRSRALIIRG